jgi:hypothetical protein
MPRIRFDFEQTPDILGIDILRPVVKLRLETAPRGVRQTCLVDTGSPDTVIDWAEAGRAGIDPSEGELVPLPDGFAVGGKSVTEARGFTVSCLIEDARYFVPLPDIPVLFIKPWQHPGFTAVLGTRAMNCIRVEVSVSGKWVEITPESEIPRQRHLPPAAP